MRDAYIAANGSDSGFERKELELRRRFGKRIQDFQAMNYEGESRLFSSLLGTYSVLQFWRSTCSSCHEFMIDFKDDYARLKQLGLAFISYSIGPDRDRDLAFIRDNGLEYSFITIGFEEDPRTYTDRYDIYATPITYVLDADATVIYLFFGYRDGYVSKLLVECLEELLSD
jgi:peroxiredoxin